MFRTGAEHNTCTPCIEMTRCRDTTVAVVDVKQKNELPEIFGAPNDGKTRTLRREYMNHNNLNAIEEELIAEINIEIGLTEARFVIARRIWSFISTPISIVITILSAIIASPSASEPASRVWNPELLTSFTITVFVLSAISTVVRPEKRWASSHRGVIDIRSAGQTFEDFMIVRRTKMIEQQYGSQNPSQRISTDDRFNAFASALPAPQSVRRDDGLSRRARRPSLRRSRSFRLPSSSAAFPLSDRIDFLRNLQGRIREIEKARGSHGMACADIIFMCSVKCRCIDSEDTHRLQWKAPVDIE